VESKTIPQLGYVFGVIYPSIIKFVEDGYGETFTGEEIHRWMKKQILGVKYKQIDSDVIEVERELKKSDRKEWSNYIDSVIIFCENRWGLIIQQPYFKE